MRTQDELVTRWIKEYCDRKFDFKGKFNIFDIGANVGGFVDIVKEVFPKSNITCFEPNKYLELEEHVKNMSNIKIERTAVSDQIGNQIFYAPKGPHALASLVQRPVFYSWTNEEIEEKEVPIITVDSYCQQNNISNVFYLKIDVEGYELNVLKGAEKMLDSKKIHFGQLEYGGCFKDNNITLVEVIKFLDSKNYSLFEGPIDERNLITLDNFVEDYRWENFIFVRRELLS
jgi:FkbM family methyltransferase